MMKRDTAESKRSAPVCFTRGPSTFTMTAINTVKPTETPSR
nr:MAG TPA: hypothetical protein [Caudoviricetes sp.]DAN11820.1 MAG TPA: hypothetical protein [Caudoviricetes sp.]